MSVKILDKILTIISPIIYYKDQICNSIIKIFIFNIIVSSDFIKVIFAKVNVVRHW